MNKCRPPLAPSLAVTLALLGGVALAQTPHVPPDPAPAARGDAAAPTPAAVDSTAPHSAAEAAAQRKARLDTLFARLAKPDDSTWQQDQTEIRAIWADSGSDSMDLLLARASKATKAQDYDEALKFLNDLVRLDPHFAEAWNARATVHFMQEDYGDAVADIERTLALEPRHFGAIAGLAIILERLGDKKGAMRAYRRGLEINPHLQGAQEAVDRLSPEVDGRSL